MKFRDFVNEAECNDLNGLSPGQKNFGSVIYNDYPGFMGNSLDPLPVRSPEVGDIEINKMLQDLKYKGLYSKDIQNILDKPYQEKMNIWKKWLEFNKKNINKRAYKESDKMLYIDFFDDIK